MSKKKYSGLEVEIVEFGDNSISTVTPVPDSGCTVGAVTYYTTDENDRTMLYGSCWYADPYEDLSFDWQGSGGSIIP